jgi:hypothetical protein
MQIIPIGGVVYALHNIIENDLVRGRRICKDIANGHGKKAKMESTDRMPSAQYATITTVMAMFMPQNTALSAPLK